MKTKKNRQRSRRMIIISLVLISILLALLNFQDVIEGLKDGARAASQAF